ncbi:hypothetical protein BV898_05337 [Hypsibius exemplaris]|uniref:Uncharacterized protein n=1 Tax=Hypsibius exemplaris TaxID=2072580 RepID=A0A1W0X020_HYPEX|nr:hypothetical protein BV898_05337 [Hypsibius exemplaris]
MPFLFWRTRQGDSVTVSGVASPEPVGEELHMKENLICTPAQADLASGTTATSDAVDPSSSTNPHIALRQFHSSQLMSDYAGHVQSSTPVTDTLKISIQSSPQFSSSSLRNTAYDRLAFKAVASTVDDLQKQGILVVSDKSPNDQVPFQMSSNVARFFMTDHQADHYSQQEPESWPKIFHPETLRQNYHTQLEVDQQQQRQTQGAELQSPLLVGTTGKKIPLFDLPYFFGNIPFIQGVCTTDDFTQRVGLEFRLARTNATKDNKIVAMLKFLIKYTDENIDAAWINRFLARPLPEEVRELKLLFESLNLAKKMDEYWANLQKQRYGEGRRWLHRLAPINAKIWAIKQMYKLRKPSRYLQKKFMWHSICYGTIGNEHSLLLPCVTSSANEIIQIDGRPAQRSGQTHSEQATTQEEAFSEWVKKSGASLSVTISFVWNELMEDGADELQTPTQEQSILMQALRDLEATIQLYGMDGQQIIPDSAVGYAGVILRFTQALHDYLEVKDRTAEMSRGRLDWSVEHESCYEDLLMKERVEEEPCVCYKCRVAWSDGTEECSCSYCMLENDAVDLPAGMVDAGLDRFAFDERSGATYEETKRMLQYLDSVTADGTELTGLGFANENVGILPDETRRRLIRSARLRTYEKRTSKNRSTSQNGDSDVSQTESALSSRDCSPDRRDHISGEFSIPGHQDKQQFVRQTYAGDASS